MVCSFLPCYVLRRSCRLCVSELPALQRVQLCVYVCVFVTATRFGAVCIYPSLHTVTSVGYSLTLSHQLTLSVTLCLISTKAVFFSFLLYLDAPRILSIICLTKLLHQAFQRGETATYTSRGRQYSCSSSQLTLFAALLLLSRRNFSPKRPREGRLPLT